jgi:hypothetical protein
MDEPSFHPIMLGDLVKFLPELEENLLLPTYLNSGNLSSRERAIFYDLHKDRVLEVVYTSGMDIGDLVYVKDPITQGEKSPPFSNTRFYKPKAEEKNVQLKLF